MEFKNWLEKYEESVLGNLALAGGLALGAGDAGGMPKAQAQATVQTPKKVDVFRVPYATPQKIAQLKQKGQKALKNLEKFKTSFDFIFDDKGKLIDLYEPGKEVKHGVFQKTKTGVNYVMRPQWEKVVNHLEERLRQFLSYNDKDLLRAYTWQRPNPDWMPNINEDLQSLEIAFFDRLADAYDDKHMQDMQKLAWLNPDPNSKTTDVEEKNQKHALVYLQMMKAINAIIDEVRGDHAQPDSLKVPASRIDRELARIPYLLKYRQEEEDKSER